MRRVDRSPFARLVHAALPGKTYREVAAELGNRVAPEALRNWIRGRVGPPAWAVESLRQRARLIDDAADRVALGRGQRAGAANLARYNARRAELKANKP